MCGHDENEDDVCSFACPRVCDLSCIPGRNAEVRGHSRHHTSDMFSYCAPLHTPDHLVSELRGLSDATIGVITDVSLRPALCGSGDLNLGAHVCRSRIFPSEPSLQFVDVA